MSRFKRALAFNAVDEAAADVRKIIIKGAPPYALSKDEARDFIAKSMESIFSDTTLSAAEQVNTCRESAAEYLACVKAFGWPADEMTEALNTAIDKALNNPPAADEDEKRRQAERARQNKEEAERRAAAVREGLSKQENVMTTPTKKHWDNEMREFAKAQRQPGETEAQAYSRLMHKSSLMQSYYDMYKRAPADVVELQAPIRKAAAFETRGHALIAMKAAEIRKAEPKLTEAQAFSKAYCDPANRDLVEMHKRELNGDAA